MKQRIYVDMDGVLAEWNSEATLEEVTSPGYFTNCNPCTDVITAIEMLSMIAEYEIYILSSVFRDDHSIIEKKSWLNKYCPFIKDENMMFCPYGNSKNKMLTNPRPDDILIDDFTLNLKEWKGVGIKLLNGINGTKGTWKGYYVSRNSSPQCIASSINAIAQIERNEVA